VELELQTAHFIAACFVSDELSMLISIYNLASFVRTHFTVVGLKQRPAVAQQIEPSAKLPFGGNPIK
jgi:hypothetical protein